MKAKYLVKIEEPYKHLVSVRLDFSRPKDCPSLSFFLPSWSPGSYLMREYAKHIQNLRVLSGKGVPLYFEKKKKGSWEIQWDGSEMENEEEEFSISYEVYCHELTVRTSHIDSSHAFLHGPSYLIGLKASHFKEIEIEFRFPENWGKLSTGLRDISEERAEERARFLYGAKDYDELLDCPVEIGNQVTDGFMVKEKPHFLAFWGETYPHERNIKGDIKTLTEHISSFMGGSLPYEDYTYITHFKKGIYGGLEHRNSTALHFDGRKLLSRQGYLNWLCLVSHEYFHTWNVKRIRPRELGPFDYENENYTRMLWLVEGLTSFVDELFVFQAGLCSLEEYLEMQKRNILRYEEVFGRYRDSLEDSSFDAWIKLYRPHENSQNSTVSYYLKGGLVFSILNTFFFQKGLSLQKFLHSLWKLYLQRPSQGVTKDEVMGLIRESIGDGLTEEFDELLTGTKDIDFDSYYSKIGLKIERRDEGKAYLGAQFDFQADNVFVKSIQENSPAKSYGLNPGDEIIALNHLRVSADDMKDLDSLVMKNRDYILTVSRLGKLMEIPIQFREKRSVIQKINVLDKARALACLKIKSF